MNEELTLKDWLNLPPAPEDIRFNTDGSEYIPIELVKPKLYYLCPTWSTKNFNHFFHVSPDGRLFCSGSVELNVSYSVNLLTAEGRAAGGDPLMQYVNRVVTGSATFDVQRYAGNESWGQTCLSLCIVAAAKELGEPFGKSLNKGLLTVPDAPGDLSKRQNKIKQSLDSALKKMKTNGDSNLAG